MSGLDKNMLLVIECLAKNRIQDAKKAAIACCANDTTKKNQRQINYCKNLLNIGSLELTTLPANLQGLIHIQDVSDFPENRYYVGTVQRQLYDRLIGSNYFHALQNSVMQNIKRKRYKDV